MLKISMLALCTVITSLLIKKQSPVTASVIGLSLCLIISINIIWGNDKKEEYKNPAQDDYRVLAQNTNESNISGNQEYNLEKKLEDILSKISGVGKVQVLITYSETSEVVAMHNEVTNKSRTEENDTNRRNKNNRNN